ncbi:MAG: hypothetical protein IH629_07145 [Thermoleophilia bacterium]|nr:hypothetical protein [Thermoleophilia bacterium]
MNWLILILGVVGLGVAGYGLVALTMLAVRRRRYLDIVLAVVVALATVVLLVTFGERIIR